MKMSRAQPEKLWCFFEFEFPKFFNLHKHKRSNGLVLLWARQIFGFIQRWNYKDQHLKLLKQQFLLQVWSRKIVLQWYVLKEQTSWRYHHIQTRQSESVSEVWRQEDWLANKLWVMSCYRLSCLDCIQTVWSLVMITIIWWPCVFL